MEIRRLILDHDSFILPREPLCEDCLREKNQVEFATVYVHSKGSGTTKTFVRKTCEFHSKRYLTWMKQSKRRG